MKRDFDVIVVGGGHAGAEAAWAGANLGARVALVTLDPSKIATMPCNPSIGGLAKGQMVREIDALGGLMALAADATGIMFKALNATRGPAVRGPRCQCDKHAYAETVQRLLRSRENITFIAGSVERINTNQPVARASRPCKDSKSTVARASRPCVSLGVAVLTPDRSREIELRAPAIVVTTGTFMRGLMHRGDERTPGGRDGEAAAVGIAAWLRESGFALGRLKTGTPPRLKRSTIAWEDLEPQFGDSPPEPFSDLTRAGINPIAHVFPAMAQVECRITRTTPESHELIRANLARAPMYNGGIESAGPRYCPSIEDKVVRFAEREAHHVFLEPESHRDESVYCNGISTSLPADVQAAIVRSMPGCERAEILKFGYAVEYDSIRPTEFDAACRSRRISGLFFAGQINGTSGYEEAAGQGLLAGLNAARHAAGAEPVTLGRDRAYIGVMMDDLVTREPVEPYRMFTSRAEHRLILRADNAADRLTTLGRELGIVCDSRWRVFESRRKAIERINAEIERARVAGEPLGRALKRPGFSVDDLERALTHTSDSGTRVSPVRAILSGTGVSPVREDRPDSGTRVSTGYGRDRAGDGPAHGSGDARVNPALLERSAMETVLADRQYAGYIDRQHAEIRRHAEMEHRRVPDWLEYEMVGGLRTEARAALSRFRPATFGQAGRLDGVTPADLSLVMIAAKRGPRAVQCADAGAGA